MQDMPSPIERRFISAVDGQPQTYLLLPPAGTPETLVVALHGHGSHQEQFMTPGIYGDALGAVMRVALTRKLLYVAPEYRGNSWMGPAAEADVSQIIAELQQEYAVQRVVVIGGSMGGTSALIYAARHAEEIHGVVAACPATDMTIAYHEFTAGPLPELAQAISASYGGTPEAMPLEYHRRSSQHHTRDWRIPTAIMHGDGDQLIAVEHSRALTACLRDAGAPVRYTEVPGGDHDAPVGLLAGALVWVLDQLA